MTLLKDESEHTKKNWIKKEKEKRNKRLMGDGFIPIDSRKSDSKELRNLINMPVDEDRIKEQRENTQVMLNKLEEINAKQTKGD